MIEPLYLVIYSAMAVSFAGGAYIDSSTWWIRALSDGTGMGAYIARTNIYSYFGRSFAFTYTACLSFVVDTGHGSAIVCAVIGCSFILGALVHLIFLNRSKFSQSILEFMARRLKLNIKKLNNDHNALHDGKAIMATTALATFLFSMALSLPYIAASFEPRYRLTISSTSQILNSFGMIFILIFVDQMLFKSWDKDELSRSVIYYNTGRFIGMGLAGILLLVLFFIFNKVM